MYDIWSGNPVFLEMFSRTPHPMWIFDPVSLCFLAVNPSALSTYGYSQDEFFAMTVRELMSGDDRERFDVCLAAMQSHIQHGGRCRHRHRNGNIIHVDMTWYRMTFNGHTAQMVLAVNVTEQVLAQERAERYVNELEAALQSTVQIIGAIGEARDASTATHAERVARLSMAIGAEMGLDEDAQAGLQIMGLLHDTGKVGIPVAILTKPKALTGPEYGLVKTHVEIGYEILKESSFKWPVAEVVLQHHERMDGSGYPHALRGNDIRKEARIVAVADVIEAISAHRPYRLGLGIEGALDEISVGAGRLYDADVARASVRLFRERGFQLN